MNNARQPSLLSNSISFFREAVNYAQGNTPDANQWKFAIINVVQAMELAFKESLNRVHPAFVYESIDARSNTVSVATAISRITDPAIGNFDISVSDKAKISKAYQLRNQLVHHELRDDAHYIESKFAEIFSFMIFFYRDHLRLQTSDFIDDEQHQKIIRLVKTRSELLQKARAYIKTIDSDFWICPECTETTFVVVDEQCCLCHHKQELVECANCGAQNFEDDLIDTNDLLDGGYEEGRYIVRERFGLERTACPNCVSDIRQTIEDIRRSQYDEDMAMDSRAYR